LAAPDLAAEAARAKGTPLKRSYFLVGSERHQFPFVFAADHRVIRFMSNVRRPAIVLRDSKGLHQLPAGKIGTCDVTDLAASDQFMQRLQRFFDRSERVESVHTVDVDVVHMEPAQTRFTRTNQIMSRRTHIIR